MVNLDEVKTEAESLVADAETFAKTEIPKVESEAVKLEGEVTSELPKVAAEVKADIPKVEAEIKADIPKVEAVAEGAYHAVQTLNTTRLYAFGALLVLILGYILWAIYDHTPPKAGAITPTATLPAVADVPQKEVHPAKLVVPANKKRAVKALGLPPSQAAHSDEEIFEATGTLPTRYGSETVTFVNLSTGKPRTVVLVKKAPWFSLERGNTVGGGVGVSNSGQPVRVYYKRDLLQVKGVYMQVEGEVRRKDKVEETGWVNLEYRF